MNRHLLIELFRRGMRYPAGTRRSLKFTRWFDIIVQPGQLIEVTEHEDTALELVPCTEPPARRYVGRTILSLKTNQIVEHSGDDW
ncbi:MAG: hypothetical protein HY600_06375 [Candidatus Omnitrophica bacterium]|nr:hypothetical protein [Candidatus Omnitrophota bacterium]